MNGPLSADELRRRRMSSLNGEPTSTARESLWRLHPDGLPAEIPSEGRSVVIEPPSKSAATQDWLSYRDNCRILLADDPDNPKKIAFLAAAEEVLAWRAALHRFAFVRARGRRQRRPKIRMRRFRPPSLERRVMDDTSPISGILSAIRKNRDLAEPTRLALAVGNHGFTSAPVALSELQAVGVTSAEIATALREGHISPVSRHVYVECNRDDLLAAFGVVSPIPHLPPAPALHAEALARQHGWRLAVGSEVAAHLCGLVDRPLFPRTMGYDRDHGRRFGNGLEMEPVPSALLDWPVAAQVLARGLGYRIDGATAEGLARHGAIIGRMPLWRNLLADQLGSTLDILSEPLRIVALAIREQINDRSRDHRAVRNAPLDWLPPAVPDHCARIEDWRLSVIKTDQGIFEVLRGRCLNHPYADPERPTFRSSRVLWIDEATGWAMVESRVYRLGKAK